MKIFCVVGNYNSWSMTCESISEIHMGGIDYEKIIVVDDGSTDGSAGELKKRYPNCQYVLKEKNGGYCKAFNSGFAKALKMGADAIFWAQNDSYSYSKNIFSRAEEEFRADPKLGLLGTKIFDPKGKIRWDSNMKNRMGVDYNISEGFFVSAAAFKAADGLDERFNVYFEDIDFFVRVTALGFTTKVIDDVSWVHIAGFTLRKTIFKPSFLRTKNLFLIIKRHSLKNGFLWSFRLILGESLTQVRVTRRVHSLGLVGWLKLLAAIVCGTIVGLFYILWTPRFKSNF